MKGMTIEHAGELVVEGPREKRQSSEDMGRLSLTEGINARLLAYPRPSLMQRAV